ncbi:hypothetical protein JL720_12619 [Aureococcus anophagefferens]|nr:hypothetical protein JL720_12619 [Aureococcus anophagefferens]
MTRTETCEVVAPKGAILRAKADKSSEMLGVLAAGSLVDVDRTMKLQICGTRRARVVAPLAGVPHAWVSLKILARRKGAAAGAAAADGDAEPRRRGGAAACEARAGLPGPRRRRRRCRRRGPRGVGLRALGLRADRRAQRVAFARRRAAAARRRGLPRGARRGDGARRPAARARDARGRAPRLPRWPRRHIAERGDDALKAALLAGGAGALHALGRFVEAGNWWRRSGQRKRSPKATSGAAHAKRLEDVLDRAAMDLRQAEAHAHLLDPTDWVLNACEALEDLAREAPACVGALRQCVLAHAALRRWDGLVAFAKAQLGGGGPAFYDGDGDDAALARGVPRGPRARATGGARSSRARRPRRTRTQYAALGAAYDDTADALKRKYRAVALRCHPDKTKAPGAEDEFKRANAAYEVLSDPAKRREYDERLRRGR